MKKTAENRYPYSATLFKFCKEALEIRYEGNVKVIDQDVGAILGYDPADCSHWKKGKKNIRSLPTLRSIADHLNIDERLLIDIAAGKVALDEAVFEYKGYGKFSLQGQYLENLKKEFFKNPNKWQKSSTGKSFDEIFSTLRDEIAKVAGGILSMGQFGEAPVYLPEVYQLVPNIFLVGDAALDLAIKIEDEGEGRTLKRTISYQGQDMRPFVRFLLAKELFKFLAASESPLAQKFHHLPDEVIDVQSNIFAGLLLVPGTVLAREMAKIESSLDLVQQLAETFWVSKSLMNHRMCDYMESLN